jgi:hypothetical protein
MIIIFLVRIWKGAGVEEEANEVGGGDYHPGASLTANTTWIQLKYK